MAEIVEKEGAGGKKGKKRAKKHPAHIDMTPMVDLACLLLTFFILTSMFSKAKVMEIVLPEKNKPQDKNQQIDDSRAVTVILAANDQVYFYNGKADPTKGYLPVMVKSNYSKDGIRKMLLRRNKALFEQVYYFNDSITKGLGKYKKHITPDSVKSIVKAYGKSDKIGPIVLIKAADGATYGNMVDIIDEMAIASIPRYAVVDMNAVDEKMLKDALAGKNTEDQKEP